MEYRKWFAAIGFVGLLSLISSAYILTGIELQFVPQFSKRIISGGRKFVETEIVQRFNPRPPKTSSDEKLVLFYTRFYWSKPWGNFSNCAYKCNISTDRNDLEKSDAVLFGLFEAARELQSQGELLPDREALNLPNQIWAFAASESPGVFTYKDLNLKPLDSVFNWSLTYRQDSDFPYTSGSFVPLLPNESTKYPLPDINSIQSRRLSVTLISRCDAESGREAYIRELRDYLPVDEYGACGRLKCNKSMDCYRVLGKKYKFWLSFENSICKDYITEKFYAAVAAGIVPVVYGYGPYSSVAPAHSYIDVRDYSSPRALAKYLLYLDRNHNEYLKYFQWRKHFKLVLGNPNFWCKFCEKLHTTDFNKTRKWYSSVTDWYERNNTNVSVCLDEREFLSRVWKRS